MISKKHFEWAADWLAHKWFRNKVAADYAQEFAIEFFEEHSETFDRGRFFKRVENLRKKGENNE